MRGEGSLMALLGRDVTKRKRKPPSAAGSAASSAAPDPSSANGQRSGQGSAQGHSPATRHGAGARPNRTAAVHQAIAAGTPSGKPLPAGSLCCPVCDCRLGNEESAASHIDKCLTKAAINKRTQQATIFQFAARTVTREPQQQQQQQQQQQRRDAARVRGSAASAALAAGAAAAAARILGAAGEREGAAEEIDLTWSSDEGDAIPHQSALKGGWRPAAAGKTGAQRGDSPPAPAAAATLPEECRRAGKQREQRREASPSVSWPSQSTPSSQEQPPVHSARRPSPAPSPPASVPAPTAATASPVGAPASPAVTPARRQQQATLQRPGRGPPPPSLLRRFQCSVVGRHFQKHEVDCRSGQRLAVECEEDNPRDANALLALDMHSRVAVGHLPHAVARQLAPLLRHGRAVAEAVVQEEPLGEREPVLVELQVTLLPAAPGASPGAARRTASALDRAEAAAAAQLAAAPRATGERLHANFLSLLDTVQQHDGHLLAEPETALIQAYKALSLPAQCLFLRLFQRKGPLFSLSSLAYKEVPDAAAAACQLATAGLAVVLEPASGGGLGQDGCQAGSGGDARAGDGAGSGQAGERAQGGGGAGGQAVDATATWTDLAELLTVPDLVAVTAARGLRVAAPQRNRAALLSALEAHAAGSAAAAAQAAAWLLEATGAVLRLAQGAREAVARLQRLFFLNEGQSLSQFLASDLGVMQYPPYAVHRSGSAFTSRQQLLAYEAALGHAAQLAEASENGDVAAAEAALQHAWAALDADMHKQARPGGHPFLSQFHAGWVYCQMASYGVHQLERQKRYQEAVQRLESLLDGCCCPGRRGEWWERLSINLKHLGRHEQALQRAEAALDDPWLSCGERLALQRRVLFLGKPPWRWKPPPWKAAALREPPELRITARPLNRTVGAKSRFYGLDDEQVGVEALALQYYASQEGGGWRGVHSEGGVWATLFGLLLWDALFMPVPDVFRTPFQTAPLDLNSPSFYPTRKEAVEGCLQRIAAGEAPRLLRLAWEQHRGVMCRGVSWDRHTLEELQQVAECVGGRGLAAVMRLLATDHAGWSGGMPDLLLWRPAKRDAKLAEVKGPRDRLSSQQTAWMHALNDAGLRAEVLKVVEPSQAGKRARRK